VYRQSGTGGGEPALKEPSISPSINGPEVDEERMRPLCAFSLVAVRAVSFLQCFDTAGRVTGEASCATYPHRFSSGINGGRTLRASSGPRFTWKIVVKMQVTVI